MSDANQLAIFLGLSALILKEPSFYILTKYKILEHF